MNLHGLLPLLVLLHQACAIPNILSLMYTYGNDMAKRATDEKHQKGSTSTNYEQYLVVTMLSRKEANGANTWKDLNHLIDNNRVKFYLNDQKQKIKGISGGATHGELIFLYKDGNALGKLEKLLPPDNGDDGGAHDNRPLLIVFSYFIPCACVKFCNFHCAEELAHAARAYKQKFEMVVGYVDVYVRQDGTPGTNADESLRFMTDGGVQIYNHIKGVFDVVKPTIPNEHTGEVDVFQIKLIVCLINNPVSVHIAVDGDDDRKKAITAAFINLATKQCFKVAPSFFGDLTLLKREYLKECIKKYVVGNVHNQHNPKNPPGFYQGMIDVCAGASLEQSNQIGYPTLGGYGQYKAIEDQDGWKDVYGYSFQVYTRDQYLPVPSCAKQAYSISSYCTKVAKGESKTGEKLNLDIMAEMSSRGMSSRSGSRERPGTSKSSRPGSPERPGTSKSSRPGSRERPGTSKS